MFFEIRNELCDIPAEEWRKQAEAVIKAIRETTPNHTLIVGFHDWNSRQALIDSKPFSDPNIIYTFHYYDPFFSLIRARPGRGRLAGREKRAVSVVERRENRNARKRERKIG